jgi:hypothetical protein
LSDRDHHLPQHAPLSRAARIPPTQIVRPRPGHPPRATTAGERRHRSDGAGRRFTRPDTVTGAVGTDELAGSAVEHAPVRPGHALATAPTGGREIDGVVARFPRHPLHRSEGVRPPAGTA